MKLVPHTATSHGRRDISMPAGASSVHAMLDFPPDAEGLVLFAHGSGSSRFSSRNQRVAAALRAEGLGTFLFDLLTPEEERIDSLGGTIRFDVELLAERLRAATQFLRTELDGRRPAFGYFGASTGAAAALIAAAHEPDDVKAVVSRGGRPDLAGTALADVAAPTLLIVGENDEPVIELNREACYRLPGEKHLEIVSGATHLFEEPGALDRVAALAGAWFLRHLARTSGATP